MSNLHNTIEYINSLSQSDPKELIDRSEQRFKNIIRDVSDKVENDSGLQVVMLAGPSASGKTTTAQKLAEEFTRRGMKTYRVSLDDFYLDRTDIPGYSEGKPDYETVFALDLPLIDKCINSLLRGETTVMPMFDFVSGKRKDESYEITLGKSDAIVLEGLHALNPIITDKLPHERILKIYISVSSRIYDENNKIILNKRNMRFIRRMVRDYNFRGSSVENTYELWDNVRSGEDKYLFPYSGLADMRINSIHLSEPCLFKETALNLLRNAELDGERAKDASRLIRALEKFNSISPDMVPETSLLCEFLG